MGSIRDRLWRRIVHWLNATADTTSLAPSLCDFETLKRGIQPADVLLVEGTSRVSEVIKTISLSPWTHAALYIGRLVDIPDAAARERLSRYHDGDPWEPLLVESLLGKGTIVTPLAFYRHHHLRICRASGLLLEDVSRVVDFAIEQLGTDYDVRQLLDLARLSFPYAILPRRWRSSLFQHNAGKPTHIVCSSMIARCFQQVGYPILPIVRDRDKGEMLRFHQRNFRLFVPSDFDYSPYFDIVKFSWWGDAEQAVYRRIEWLDEKGGGQENEPAGAAGRGRVIELAGRILPDTVARRWRWSG